MDLSIKMTYLTKAVILLLCLMTSVNAGVFDKSFLVRMEGITNTNRELTETNRNLSDTNEKLSETNKELNATVVEQRNMMAELNETIQQKDATIQLLTGKLYCTVAHWSKVLLSKKRKRKERKN